jgi:serine phosphatase RsbU (regulator of sigma subunit)
VNRLFYESTADNAYATFFYSEFDDRANRLRYVNCGHLPALVLRGNGEIDRLQPTALVLGLFSPWECRMEDLRLSPGDLLAIYTDGITEAFDASDDEFGEARLIETLRTHRDLPPDDVIASVYDDVRRFSPHEQRDDMTLIVARCRNC